MDLYFIRRRDAAKTPDEMEAAGKRSGDVAESDFPDSIAWIRSYVTKEPSGALGTVCIYQAASEDAVREHATKAGLPADEIMPIADTIIVRPDPAAEAA